MRTMNKYLMCIGAMISVSMARGEVIQCPAKVNLEVIAATPPPGWLAYKGNDSFRRKGEMPGAFRRLSLRDGSPLDVLGDLILDNEDTGQKQGYWLWTVKELPEVYIGCEYVGSNILLVKKLESGKIDSCRTTVAGNKRLLLTCQ